MLSYKVQQQPFYGLSTFLLANLSCPISCLGLLFAPLAIGLHSMNIYSTPCPLLSQVHSDTEMKSGLLVSPHTPHSEERAIWPDGELKSLQLLTVSYPWHPVWECRIMQLPKSWVKVESNRQETETRETRTMEGTCFHIGFRMECGRFQSILRAGKSLYVEVGGFPFQSWALGRSLHFQAGTSHGGSGLGPSVRAANTVRASPPPPRGCRAKPPTLLPS